MLQGSLEFIYIDVWSSPWTWGGDSIPVEGELVVIREGHTVLLDVDTPILNTLLIDGKDPLILAHHKVHMEDECFIGKLPMYLHI